MPLQSIDLLLEYNQERIEEGCNCGTPDPELPTREAAFIGLAKQLAEHPKVVVQLLPMLDNPELNVAQKQMIFYLLWQVKDQSLAKQALEKYFQTDDLPFDLLPALGLLENQYQSKAIAGLAAQNSKATCETLAGHFLANDSVDEQASLSLFLNDEGQARFEGGVFDLFAAQSQHEPLQQSLINRFEYAEGIEKTILAQALLFAQNNGAEQRKALYWLSQGEGMVHDHCRYFALLSAPTDFKQLHALKNAPLQEAQLLKITDALKWYGNPSSFSFLRWGMQYENVKVKQAFHGVLMAFFDENDPEIFEGFMLCEEGAAEQKDYSKQLEHFWTVHEKALKQQLNSQQRYVESSPFNLEELFQYYQGKPRSYSLEHTTLSQFLTYVSLWTGQRVYYDKNALLSKQCQQMTVVKQKINIKSFTEGGRYQFGHKVSYAL